MEKTVVEKIIANKIKERKISKPNKQQNWVS
jgi:hypothetical protein